MLQHIQPNFQCQHALVRSHFVTGSLSFCDESGDGEQQSFDRSRHSSPQGHDLSEWSVCEMSFSVPPAAPSPLPPRLVRDWRGLLSGGFVSLNYLPQHLIIFQASHSEERSTSIFFFIPLFKLSLSLTHISCCFLICSFTHLIDKLLYYFFSPL